MSDLDPANGPISKSFTQAIKDRLSHPVAGVFIIAWMLFNWKMLFFLVVAGSPAEARIAAATRYTDWALGFSWPALATIGYVVIAPLLGAAASWWSDWVARKEADRIYKDQLDELVRNADLAQRRLQSREQAVGDQQARLTILETQVQHKTNDLRILEVAIKDLTDLSNPAWKFAAMPTPGNLASLAEKFNHIEKLKQEIRERNPAIGNWLAKP